MAWTTPKTWTSGAVTAAEFNEQIRDNLAYIKALAILEETYEVNSWTPAFGVTGTGVPTTTSATGRYQRIGNTVRASCTVTGSLGSAVSGYVNISGLPFAAGTALTWWSAHVGYATGWLSLTGYTLTGVVQSGASVITLIGQKDALAALVEYYSMPVTTGPGSGSCSIAVTVIYEV